MDTNEKIIINGQFVSNIDNIEDLKKKINEQETKENMVKDQLNNLIDKIIK